MAGMALAAQPARAADDAGARLAAIEAQVQAAEDVSAIKRLQRTYGYFLDKGLWTDLAEYFTDDAVANYPAGIYVGKESIRQHLYRNVGNVPMGQVGLGENRLYNHMNIQPVVHLDPGGQGARGRWRAFAMFGSLNGGATWAEGVYELRYRKQGGVWKIAQLDYYGGFGAPYATGWVPPAPPAAGAAPAPRRPRNLPHPADRTNEGACGGFPAACIAPFHYPNPGKGAGAPLWSDLPTPATVSRAQSPRTSAGLLLARVKRLAAEQQVENLQRIYGYYIDRGYWDQAADLFADKATLEVAQQGVYVGRKRIRDFLAHASPQGLVPGWLNDHIQLQPVVTVSADGRQAWSRSREFSMTGHLNGAGQWSEGIYENRFVNEGGVWKFASLHYFPTFISDYDKGWGKDAQPAPAPYADLPPDRPPTQVYQIFPKAHVPPFHYRNPVTNAAVTYPAAAAGGPTPQVARAALAAGGQLRAAPVRDVDEALAEVARLVDRVKSVHEIENLESAYGFYLDKNLWNDLADLFAPEGSIELAMRGVYGGPKVREFLLKVFGRGQEGPVAGRLGNHVQMQPVITLSEDGRSAKVRQRMVQQMNLGSRASHGGAIYENEVVRGADGVWRFSKVNAYNTFSAGYEGGWMRAPGRGMPGPSPELLAWDSPPTREVMMLPIVYEIPYHYANPVTGRTQLPPLPLVAQQLRDHPVPPPAPRASSAPAGMPPEVAAGLRSIGPRIEGAGTTALYAPLFKAISTEGVKVTRDAAYGPHERHRVDVFTTQAIGAPRPMVVFIHGGGFARGAKSAPGSPFYDNIGNWAAAQGLVGVTLNYRLAPQFQYPAGAEDLARAVTWLRAQARQFGGDPARIYLWGHSAGGAHVADYLVRTPRPAVAGAILTSGIYDLGESVSIWKDYYGEDVAKYAERSSLRRLAQVDTPLLVSWAELDPPNFVADSTRLVELRKASGKPMTTVLLPNHSHLSETYAIGTADQSLSGPVLQFIKPQ
jgi:triacylglycerol lipase